MNTIKILLSTFVGIVLFFGCDDNDHSPTITSEAEKAFSEKYPSATHVSWDQEGTYLVAEFQENSQASNAWFNTAGHWFMTETDQTWEQLPEAVKNAFQASEYSQWRIDDVDMLERNEAETVYIIEVEKGGQEFDLYFNNSGVFIQASVDSDDDYLHLLPTLMPDKIKAAVLEMYPNAHFVDIETEHGITEVTIIDGMKSKEIRFNTALEWLETEYDITSKEVPAPVMTTLNAQYPNPYVIDEVECHETPEGKFYHFEIEINDRDSEINIREDGTIRS